MDFVVSKVAMTICALVVVSVLAGAFENSFGVRDFDELDSILRDLASTLERLVWSGCKGEAIWDVPYLSDGDGIEISVRDSAICAWADHQKAVLRAECSAQTWTWNGTELNQSSLDELRADSRTVLARSGLSLEIQTQVIVFENQDRIFAFVSTVV